MNNKALPTKFYTAFAGGPGQRWNLGFDAQAVHGLEHSKNGQLVSAGISWDQEGQPEGARSAFVIAGDRKTGAMDWYFKSDGKGTDEGVVAVAEMAGGDVIAAGFFSEGHLDKQKPPVFKAKQY